MIINAILYDRPVGRVLPGLVKALGKLPDGPGRCRGKDMAIKKPVENFTLQTLNLQEGNQ
ncbi:hypothetical protein DXN05_09625 [Deminuibacter soli]|uniref:Uncharacterized protein n=1 Tax=Deminuibacter soli TaxID=2291815 RepID=A0A3E1NM60_9BACT|nr:hypothetical protein DXN05_09625 [Deminuibacter soli]